MEFPRSEGDVGRIAIDTGADGPVSLSPKLWQKWKADHPADPVTLENRYMPAVGWRVIEVMWAREIGIGPFKLSNVKIKEANIGEISDGSPASFEASLTVEALQQLSLMVDGSQGYLYWASKSNWAGQAPRNLAGVLFAPLDPEKGGDLIAHVVPNGPAARAGLEEGDIVVKVNSLAVENWGDDRVAFLNALLEKPPGSKIFLVVKRKGQILERVLTLKNIFDPAHYDSKGEDSLIADARVLGEPLKMTMDSSNSASGFYRRTAERLNLPILPSQARDDSAKSPATPASPKSAEGETVECTIQAFGEEFKGTWGVATVPDYVGLGTDGGFGWLFFKDNILVISAAGRSISGLGKLPPETAGWHKVSLKKDSDVLMLEAPLGQGETGAFLIDTGSEGEVELSPKNWAKWKNEHPADPLSLTATFSSSFGIVVREVMWVKKLVLGPIELSNVTIKEASPKSIELGGKDYQMTLSLEALKQMDLVVDGKAGFAYWTSREGEGEPPRNRSGMIVAPHDLASDDLIAYVVKGSPAAEAGIQTGDILLKVNSRDMTKWKSDKTTIKFSPLAEQHAGSKITLLLKRDGKEFEVVITLREIFGQAVGPKP